MSLAARRRKPATPRMGAAPRERSKQRPPGQTPAAKPAPRARAATAPAAPSDDLNLVGDGNGGLSLLLLDGSDDLGPGDVLLREPEKPAHGL